MPRRIHGTADSGIAGMERRMVRRGGGKAGTLTEAEAEALHAACCGAALRQTSMNREKQEVQSFSPFSQPLTKSVSCYY